MRFGSSPQVIDAAQTDLRRTILPFAAATPADIATVPGASRPLQFAAARPQPLFSPSVPEALPPEPDAPPAPKPGIPDAAARGVDLLSQVGQRRLAPEFALEDFVGALGTMNLSRAAAAKLTETFAVSLQKAAAQRVRSDAPAHSLPAQPDASSPEAPITVVPSLDEPESKPGSILSRIKRQPRPAPPIEGDRRAPDVFRPKVPAGISPLKADELLQAQRVDPVSFTLSAPQVETARAEFERSPTAENSIKLSRELIRAQLKRGIPTERLTPLTEHEARHWAQSVLNLEVDLRHEAVRELAIQMQRDHGEHADLALRAIARHWADDEASAAFASALIELMDGARVLPRMPPQTEEGEGLGVPPDAGPFRALGIDPSRSDRLAHLNRTPASVRDARDHFLRGEPLGEAVHVGTSVGIREPNGNVRLTDRNRHVVLFDEESERWLVFERTFLNDTFDRPMVVPFVPGGVRNERTGERSTGLSELADVALEASLLLGDGAAGLLPPESDQLTERVVEAAEIFSPATAVRVLRRLGPRVLRRAMDRDTVTQVPDGTTGLLRRGGVDKLDADLGERPDNTLLPLTMTKGLPTVKVKTTNQRSSNAAKGTPEWEMLNNPESKTIYTLDNGETFVTNEFGHVRELRYKPSLDKRGRDNRQTQLGKEGLDNDVGAHLRGCFSGGTCDAYNLVAQDKNFNNGLYRRWENVIRQNIHNVDAIKITVERKIPSVSRPDGFRVEWVIKGVKFLDAFKNRHGGR